MPLSLVRMITVMSMSCRRLKLYFLQITNRYMYPGVFKHHSPFLPKGVFWGVQPPHPLLLYEKRNRSSVMWDFGPSGCEDFFFGGGGGCQLYKSPPVKNPGYAYGTNCYNICANPKCVHIFFSLFSSALAVAMTLCIMCDKGCSILILHVLENYFK